MCVIYAVYKNLPSDAELERGAFQNDDGAGICWRDRAKNTIRWMKGLESKVEAIKQIIEKQHIVAPFAIHFRTASIGGVDPDLTHPFPVYKGVPLWQAGNASLVLMHNGHISDWKQWTMPIMLASKDMTPLPPWSDSRALAYAVHQKGEGILEFILGGSRALLMDATPSEGCKEDDPESYFRLYGAWHHNKEEGFYQSTETLCSVRGKGRGSAGWDSRATREDSTASPNASAAIGGKVLSLVKSDTNISVWTVDELEKLANEIEKEQSDAATVVGL
jgi:hypothetical protein